LAVKKIIAVLMVEMGACFILHLPNEFLSLIALIRTCFLMGQV